MIEFKVKVSGVANVTQHIYVVADNEADARAIVMADEEWHDGIWEYDGLVEYDGLLENESDVRIEKVERYR